MAKIDHLFKDKLSNDSIEKLDLEQSWLDFSALQSKDSTDDHNIIRPKTNLGLKSILGITSGIILIGSLLTYCYLSTDENTVDVYKNENSTQLNSKSAEPIIKTNKKGMLEQKTDDLSSTNVDVFNAKEDHVQPSETTIEKEDFGISSKKTIFNTNEDYVNKPGILDNTEFENVDPAKENVNKPVVIKKTTTIAVQKTDTIISFEEKKKRLKK